MAIEKLNINGKLFPLKAIRNAGLIQPHMGPTRNPFMEIGRLPDKRRIVINQAEGHTPGVFSGWLVPATAETKRLAPGETTSVIVKISRYEQVDFWHLFEVSLLNRLDFLQPDVPAILHEGKVPVVHHSSITKGVILRDAPFFIMSRLDGQPFSELAKAWQNRPPRREELANLLASFASLAVLLAKVHGENGEPAGIIHRDIKPANLIHAPHSPALIDFGSANYFGPLAPKVIRRDCGTPGFFPPEFLAAGIREDDARIDTYGLGATLISLLTGYRPLMYPGVSDPWKGKKSPEERGTRYAKQIWAYRHQNAAQLAKASNLPGELKGTPLAEYLFTLAHPLRGRRPVLMSEVANKLEGFKKALEDQGEI
ncbi:MAG: hypothetical protein ABIH56_07310 [Candidatus Margulisiibacteriota bacterium]